MAFVEINGVAATQFSLRLPLSGAWDAEAEVTTTDVSKVTGKVTINFAGTGLVGTTKKPGTDQGGKTTIRIVAGAGGLDAQVEPLGYGPTFASSVLNAILARGGETLDAATEPELLGFGLTHWVRLEGDVASAIRRLVEYLASLRDAGATWRLTLAGLVWIGTETWPEIAPTYVLEHEAPTEGWDLVAIETLGILPGTTFRGRHVSGVEYTVDASKCRARVSYDGAKDPLADEFTTFVRRQTAHLDYAASYDVRVAKQNDDGTLEVVPYSKRLPGLSRVPIRGLPGCKVKVSPGARATLRFLDGVPAKPYVSDFEPSGLVELQLGEGASHRLASGDAALAWVLAILSAPCASPGSPLVVTPPFLYPSPTSIRSNGPART